MRDLVVCRTRSTSHSVAARGGCTKIPLAAGGAQEDETILDSGYWVHANARFVDLAMLKDYVQQMVKMSPLQRYSIEIVQDDTETRVIGAAVSAEQAAAR